jgi:hypothetical protein
MKKLPSLDELLGRGKRVRAQSPETMMALLKSAFGVKE